MTNEELMHYGVPGMRWGVRRRRPSDGDGKSSKPKKNVKDLSDDELRKRINRLQMEKQYRDLESNDRGKSAVGEFFKEAGKKIILESAVSIGAQVAKHFMAKGVNNLIGEKERKYNKDTGEWEETLKEVVFANNKKKS